MAELGQEKLAAPKRFYQTVSLREGPDGFALLLDGREARTRARAPLAMTTPALAEAVAQEWRDCGETIDFSTMPLTRLRMTVLDRGAADRGGWLDTVLDYLHSDLLVYRADAPEALAERQAKAWDPVLADLARSCGLELRATAGIVHIEQPASLRPRAEAILAALSDDILLCVKEMTDLLGSAALAIAVEENLLSPREAFSRSRIDEEFQIERWGRDAEADAALARRRADYDAVCAYLAAAR